MKKLILASNNKHKLFEFGKMVQDMDIELLSQSEAGLNIEVDETGTTFEENAYLKAKAVTDATGCAAVADDSGIVVDCLGGAPGIYSARYGKGIANTDEERMFYLLEQVGDAENRAARYVCAICCTMPDGTVLRTRGEIEGEILHEPVGNGGFGYDPIFKPLCTERGMAELTPEEKNAISHRGKAMEEFKKIFEEYNKCH